MADVDTAQEPSNGWMLESEETRFDTMMGRDYTTVCYRESDSNRTIRIFEIQEPKSNSWAFQVRTSGWTGETHSAEDLDDAREIALQMMDESRPT